jgi:hypothetical protein
LILFGVGLLLAPQVGLTQEESLSCTPLIEQGFAQLQANCAGLENGSACFAFNTVNATGDGAFNEPGDRSDLSAIQAVQTAALDPALEQWGIAVMNVQANVPTALDGQGVRFLMLGDVQVENAVAPENALQVSEPITVTVLVGANLRSGPSTNAQVLASAPAGTELQADGLSRDEQWLRVFHEGKIAWVSRSVLAINDPLDNLPVWGGDGRTLMQDFFFSTGNGLAQCEGALPALLIIQGPENIPVSLRINGEDIRLDSTMALWITPDNEMRVMVLEGAAQIGNLSIPAGFTAKALLSEDGHSVSGPWENMRAMTPDERAILTPLENLPVESLNNNISIPTEGAIQEMLAALSASNIGEARAGTASGDADCSRFRPTSPLGGLAFGPTTFYWDAALGADNYRINIYNESGTQVGTFVTNSANTAISVDTSAATIGDGLNFTWEVVALVNNQVACTSSQVVVLREAGASTVGSGGGDGDDDGGGGGPSWGS